mmetsp:Transcript_11074/g.25810  ORF Transcript_11074/g.25810 Transcript_11074/m.25810 type:complete len:116 (+) Transcript_11074:1317-1664(+)
MPNCDGLACATKALYRRGLVDSQTGRRFRGGQGRKTSIGTTAHEQATPNDAMRVAVHQVIGWVATQHITAGDAIAACEDLPKECLRTLSDPGTWVANHHRATDHSVPHVSSLDET